MMTQHLEKNLKIFIKGSLNLIEKVRFNQIFLKSSFLTVLDIILLPGNCKWVNRYVQIQSFPHE